MWHKPLMLAAAITIILTAASARFNTNSIISTHNNTDKRLCAVKDKTSCLYGYKYCNDKSGDWIILPKYLKAEDFNDRFALVNDDNKWGVIDIRDSIVLPLAHEEIKFIINNHKVNDSLFIFRKNNAYGVVNKHGEYIAQPIYSSINTSFFNDCIFAHKKSTGEYSNTMALITLQGKLIGTYCDISNSDPKGYWGLCRYTGNKGEKNCLLTDQNFKSITNETYTECRFSTLLRNLVIIGKGEHIGAMDYTGNVVIPVIYDGILYNSALKHTLFYTKDSGVLVNTDGEIVRKDIKYLKNHYPRCPSPYKSSTTNKWGIIDKNAKDMAPPIYQYIESHTEMYGLIMPEDPSDAIRKNYITHYFMRDGNNYTVIDDDGNTLFNDTATWLRFEVINQLPLLIYKSANTLNAFNLLSKKPISLMFFVDFENGIGKLELKSSYATDYRKYGGYEKFRKEENYALDQNHHGIVIDTNGIILLDGNYAIKYGNGFYVIWGDNQKVINLDGNTLVPFGIYRDIQLFKDKNYCAVQSRTNYKWGIINGKTGELIVDTAYLHVTNIDPATNYCWAEKPEPYQYNYEESGYTPKYKSWILLDVLEKKEVNEKYTGYPPNYFINGLFIVRDTIFSSNCTLINKDGEEIAPAVFRDIWHVDSTIYLSIYNSTLFIPPGTNRIINPECREISNFYNGYAFLRNGSKLPYALGLVSKTGEVLVYPDTFALAYAPINLSKLINAKKISHCPSYIVRDIRKSPNTILSNCHFIEFNDYQISIADSTLPLSNMANNMMMSFCAIFGHREYGKTVETIPSRYPTNTPRSAYFETTNKYLILAGMGKNYFSIIREENRGYHAPYTAEYHGNASFINYIYLNNKIQSITLKDVIKPKTFTDFKYLLIEEIKKNDALNENCDNPLSLIKDLDHQFTLSKGGLSIYVGKPKSDDDSYKNRTFYEIVYIPYTSLTNMLNSNLNLIHQ